MSDIERVKALFADASVALSRDDVWAVQGTPVVKHKALERLAAALKIRFEKPDILRHERDEAVLLVSGSLGEASEWSIGEAAVNVNYRVTGKMSAYVYAMAEKRAKDRVIIKLANLQGVYSEEEADEFKERGPAEREESSPPPARGQSPPTSESKAQQIKKVRELLADLGRKEASLLEWATAEKMEDISSPVMADIIGMLAAAKKSREASVAAK